jgi:hypothetical protein
MILTRALAPPQARLPRGDVRARFDAPGRELVLDGGIALPRVIADETGASYCARRMCGMGS